jgi:hypothetical protein
MGYMNQEERQEPFQVTVGRLRIAIRQSTDNKSRERAEALFEKVQEEASLMQRRLGEPF